MVDRLDRLRDALLVQCESSEVNRALEIADRPGTGVVVTKPKLGSIRDAAATAGGRPLLVDAERYAGRSRLPAVAEFDPDWLAAQRDAGLVVLTDSGFTARGDEEGLVSILHRAADLGDAVGVLALDTWWLNPHGGLERLLGHVGRVGVPVALVLQHSGDPLGATRTLCGLLALIDVGVPVIQLRCDVSGLGLLCHGAWAAAVGTRTRLRHLHPPAKPQDRGGGRPASVSTVVRECLAYRTIGRIALAVQADREDSLWQQCTCRTCLGRQLDWINELPNRRVQEQAAFGHALEMLFDLRDGLVRLADRGNRQISWREHCNLALARFEEINHARQRWEPPKFLKPWYKLAVPRTPAAAPTSRRREKP